MNDRMGNELLDDFLTEAGEIIDQLQAHLLRLEQDGADQELLNAVFRGFHTVKGGAGFLQIAPMVDCCHAAEGVFDLLRRGERLVTPVLMDVMLRVLDTLASMLAALRAGDEVDAPDPGMMTGMAEIVAGVDRSLAVAVAAEASLSALAESPRFPLGLPVSTEPGADDLMGDDEFESLLDELHGKGGAVETVDAAAYALIQSPGAATYVDFAALALPVAPERGAGPASASEGDTRSPAINADATLRVDTKLLDHIMNMVGELVLVRNRLVRLGQGSEDEALGRAIANLDVVTADLQASVLKTRMQPIKKVFGRFPRVVRDLARTLHKQIDLVLVGEDTELDKNLVEALADPLVHLVRNAVDHGIEMAPVRVSSGKAAVGRIVLSAEQQGDHIELCIADDGRGMDVELLRRKAVEKGLLDADAAARLSRIECLELIFAVGFSTKDEISDVSGRGVGMDVVKHRITQLNGVVGIESALGKGTRISIRLPLTLAIMPTLMIKVGERTFALPLASVAEICSIDLAGTHQVDGQEIAVVRGKALTIYHLSAWLLPNPCVRRSGRAHLVVVELGSHAVGLVVDQLIGQEEVVIKPLGALLQGTAGLAGATITGDGRVALILDVPSMVQRYG